jgi:hypothetical protein
VSSLQRTHVSVVVVSSPFVGEGTAVTSCTGSRLFRGDQGDLTSPCRLRACNMAVGTAPLPRTSTAALGGQIQRWQDLRRMAIVCGQGRALRHTTKGLREGSGHASGDAKIPTPLACAPGQPYAGDAAVSRPLGQATLQKRKNEKKPGRTKPS